MNIGDAILKGKYEDSFAVTLEGRGWFFNTYPNPVETIPKVVKAVKTDGWPVRSNLMSTYLLPAVFVQGE